MIRLLPRQDTFFDMFEKQVDMVNDAAHRLHELVTDYKDVEDAAFKLRAMEHDADEVAHTIMNKLNMTFVTPLDREDIHELASALDDIMDFVEAAVDRMALYEVAEPTDEAIKLCSILAQATEETVKAVYGLRDLKKPEIVREACVAINRLENEGDQANRMALSKLFQMHENPIEALKWREIYDQIETAIDECEDVADIIESVMLKSA
ncbi:MAG: DUF47 family protein [Armatimonadetes bacterium]|nr:DUF47 family protein [Armatimonadota bacterium]